MIHPSESGACYELDNPLEMPKASGFLWNETMMIQATCRGYATAQFMQPEPSKYAHAPITEAKTFMLPEQQYYTDYPGRFVYLKDEEDGTLFSAPYEPVRRKPDSFAFQVGAHRLVWRTTLGGVTVTMTLSLPIHDPVELWRVSVTNQSGRARQLSLYPFFTVGFMSWLNQGAVYRDDLQAIVCSSVTPYQKSEDYPKIKGLKDKTFLWAQQKPEFWEASQDSFLGEGGLHAPSAIAAAHLGNSECHYEIPAAAMQYRLSLEDGEEQTFEFIFGPAKDEDEIRALTQAYNGRFAEAETEYAAYIARGAGVLKISTPDAGLDNYVNHWLSRQAYYHGVTNRLTTDPQTRNYIQDAMGMSYIEPSTARAAFVFALGQQSENGEMPDGILLYPGAELKYINQVPHTDHCVWLPVCLRAYLEETGDYALLDETVPFAGGQKNASVAQHIDRAMDWLIHDRDERGMNYIRQGDWNDPMNMVGYKGKGVSGWLTMGTAFALLSWAEICEAADRADVAAHYREQATEINGIINRHLWDGDWYARGITDDGVVFGVSTDPEGRIYLNSQSWAILCGAAGPEQQARLIQSVEEQLETPYGVEMLAPAYTAMREDVGRLTQKYPGVTENGSVYNHAAAFYIYALYETDETDNAYRLLRKMLPGEDREDILRRGQLPVFIPNCYRGAYRQFPQVAGRSSHLFNTGTISWYYRCLVDGLFGLRGTKAGLTVCPKLPSHWDKASITRRFRGAEIQVDIRRDESLQAMTVHCDGKPLIGGVLTDIQPGQTYRLTVALPK